MNSKINQKKDINKADLIYLKGRWGNRMVQIDTELTYGSSTTA